MALPRSPVLGPLRSGSGVASVGGALVPPPSQKRSSSSWRLIPVLTALRLPTITPTRIGNLVATGRRTVPLTVRCFGSGGWSDERDVEDEDADIDELLARLQEKLVVNVQPLQESRRGLDEEAVRKGRKMLFQLFCIHLGAVTPREVRAIWCGCGGEGKHGSDRIAGGGAEDQKLRLVRDFLQEEWSTRYRPLSPRAAAEMLEEHLGSLEETETGAGPPGPPTKSTAASAPGFGRLLLLPNWWR